MISPILTEIAGQHNLARKTDRWIGRCPKCGGSDTSDRFQIRDDGGYKCYGCGWGGDLITWLREMEGKNCAEAHEAAGLPCRNLAGCPAAESCRLNPNRANPGNQGTRRPNRPRPQALAPKAPPKTATLPSTTPKGPLNAWSTWAEHLAARAAAQLPNQKAVLTWLNNRGIDQATATRFGLGWAPKQANIARAKIDLPPKDGKPNLWVPVGLLIPIRDDACNIHRIRIRRPGWSRESFLPDLKYVWLEGSGNRPLVIRPLPGHPLRAVVIVEAELDAYAIAAANPDVMVIALGTVAAGLPPDLYAELQTAPLILLALDADEAAPPTATPAPQGGKRPPTKPGAGPQNIAKWRHEFRQAKYWPTPAGKDPGDYVQAHQGDLRAWIEAGLIPAAPAPGQPVSNRITTPPPVVPGPAQEQMTPLSAAQPGEGGENPPAEVPEPVAVETITLADGRQILITDDRAEWDRLTAAGQPVFTRPELARLVEACKHCTPAQAHELAHKTLLAKQTFGGHITAGGPAGPEPTPEEELCAS